MDPSSPDTASPPDDLQVATVTSLPRTTSKRAAVLPRNKTSLGVDGLMVAWGLPLLGWQVLFFLVPLVLLILMSFWTVQNYELIPRYTFTNWTDFLSTSYLLAGYLRTVEYATVASVVAILVAFPFAYALAFKVSSSTRRLAMSLLITPFFTSYLVRSYSWQVILANNGLLNALLGSVGLPHMQLLNTPPATLIGYLTYVFPLVTLLLLVGLTNVDRTLIEAANNLGAGRIRTVFTVVIPASRVGLAFSGVFAFILSFGDFVAPSLLGGGNPPTLSILIIDTVKSASNWPEASVIALVMVLTLMFVLFAGFRLAFPSAHQR